MVEKEDKIGRSAMLPPLPERMRPRSLDDYVGQRHLVGPGCILRNMILIKFVTRSDIYDLLPSGGVQHFFYCNINH